MVTGKKEIIFRLKPIEGGYKSGNYCFYAYDEDQDYLENLVNPKQDMRLVWDPRYGKFEPRRVIVDNVAGREEVFFTLDEVNRG